MSAYELKNESAFVDGKCDRSRFFDNNPALQLLGVKEIFLRESGESELILPLDRKHTNIHGIVHGGIYVTMLDTAMGVACHYKNGKPCVTLGITTSFISNCKPGIDSVTIGRVVHIGRRIMVAEGEVFDDKGQLMAKGQGTFFVLGEHPSDAIKAPDSQTK